MSEVHNKKREEQEAQYTGGVALSLLTTLIYGVYRLIVSGLDIEAFRFPVLLIIGSLLSAISARAYLSLGKTPARSWANSAKTFGGFIPYLFALYLIVYVGIWSIISMLWTEFASRNLFFGVFWTLIGYWLLSHFSALVDMRNS